MKRKTKIIIGLAAACAGTLLLGACSGKAPYDDYAKEGFTVSVRYDMNGGKALSNNRVSIVDTYKLEDVQRGVKLLAPDDPRRVTASPVSIERSGYFLAGWYAERAPRIDGEGKALDEDGNVCDIEIEVKDENGNPMYDSEGNVVTEYVSANGKSQGYTYKDPWDFSKDIFGGAGYTYEYQEEKVALTLYAAWVPHFSYRLMGAAEKDEEGKVTKWDPIATYTFNPLTEDTADNRTIPVPSWDESSGEMSYGKLIRGSGYDKTFEKAYSDPEKTHEVTSLVNEGTWDPATATSTDGMATYYADWLDGTWLRITNEKQLVEHANVGYSYDIFADLDFSQTEDGALKYSWPTAFSTGIYSGTFHGHGHTIKGVTVHQTGAEDARGGLFGALAETAVIDDITFSDLTYSLEKATNTVGSFFGTFAGEIRTGAKVEKVTVGGKLVIGKDIQIPQGIPMRDENDDYIRDENGRIMYTDPPHIYDIGLVTGNLVTAGITANITLETAEGISAHDDGTGRIVLN